MNEQRKDISIETSSFVCSCQHNRFMDSWYCCLDLMKIKWNWMCVYELGIYSIIT